MVVGGFTFIQPDAEGGYGLELVELLFCVHGWIDKEVHVEAHLHIFTISNLVQSKMIQKEQKLPPRRSHSKDTGTSWLATSFRVTACDERPGAK